jgi:hypothetical protein
MKTRSNREIPYNPLFAYNAIFTSHRSRIPMTVQLGSIPIVSSGTQTGEVMTPIRRLLASLPNLLSN